MISLLKTKKNNTNIRIEQHLRVHYELEGVVIVPTPIELWVLAEIVRT